MENLNELHATYPKPKIPTAPVLSWSSIGFKSNKTPAILDLKNVLYLTSGRSAIGLALKALNIQAGDEILIPAYHCTSMVEPTIWLDAKPVFFKIHGNTKINLSHIKQLITKKTRAIIVVNYFGFLQDMEPIRKICDEHSIGLIEDCAHSFFGGTPQQPIGALSDYVIASSLKFFPIFDGGGLCSNRNSLKMFVTKRAGLAFEIKSLINNLERAFDYKRLKPLSAIVKLPLFLKSKLRKTLKHRQLKNGAEIPKISGPAAADGGFHFDPNWVDKKMSITSRLIMNFADKSRIISKRRNYYNKWHTALSDCPGGKALFPQLPENVIPHVYPYLVDQPETVFPHLKNMGVPIIRFGEYLWEGVDESICSISTDLSRRTLQFPCHQELTEKEVEWAIKSVRNALTLKQPHDTHE